MQQLDVLQNKLCQHFNDETIKIQGSKSQTTAHYILFINSRQHNYRVCVQISFYELAVSKYDMIETMFNKIVRTVNKQVENKDDTV